METFYKVIWVDDQLSNEQGETSYFTSFQLQAERYDIEFEKCTCWDDAEAKLKQKFDNYSAIILDAYCGIGRSDSQQEHFIMGAMLRLLSLFKDRGKQIPWYILSAGTMNGLNTQLDGVRTQHQSADWGDMYYAKTNNDDSIRLLENIKTVAAKQETNVVLQKYDEIFKYIGENRLLNSAEARHLMKRMLCVLHFPEKSSNNQYVGNPIRKVMEHLFRSARDKGLAPEEFFDGDRIAMQWVSLFMAGKSVTTPKGNFKWGNDNDSIFPEGIANVVKDLLSYSNGDSHTKDETYTKEGDESWQIDDRKYLFLGNLLRLCYVIKWFGEYVDAHNNPEENRRSIIKTVSTDDTRAKYEGVVCTPEKDDEENCWHYEECYLTIKYWNDGKKMKLKNIQANTNSNFKEKYPYFANYEMID